MRPRIAACAVAASLLLAVSAHAAAQPLPGAHLRADGHIVLAFLHGGSGLDYGRQVQQMPGVTVVSPTWWGLDAGDPGAITDAGDPAFAAWARESGKAVWPLLGNRLDAELSHTVLADDARRARLVGATVRAVDRAGVDGVVVGFDNLRHDTGPGLTAFVGELRAALPGRVVAVTVAALTDTWSLGSWSTAYERAALGELADYVLLQALDEHHDGSPPGPVAGMAWSLEAVEHLLRSVPDHKIVLGVPLYARDWVESRVNGDATLHATLGMAEMAQRLDAAGATHEFDPVAGQRVYTYRDGRGRTHRVWQEDPASLARRATLASSYNLAGVAAWRGGFAGAEAWEAMNQALARDPRPTGPASGPPRLNPLVPLPRTAPPEEAAPPPDAAPPAARPPLGAASRQDGDPPASQPAGAAWFAGALVLAMAAALLWVGRPARTSRSVELKVRRASWRARR